MKSYDGQETNLQIHIDWIKTNTSTPKAQQKYYYRPAMQDQSIMRE
jgi:hypothetical protein